MNTKPMALLRGALGLAVVIGLGWSTPAQAGNLMDELRSCWAGDACCDDECCLEDECCEDVCCDDCDWCNLGDPWLLQDALFPEDLCDCEGEAPFTIGGWTQIGYHTQSNGQFNNIPDRVNLHQQWLYAERVADGSKGVDFGFRMDAMYGIDSLDTAAFGGEPQQWDLPWQTGGGYGWAIPQLYAEVAVGDLSVKAGHFYTLIGYEVVTAPDNFFYSHAFTMYNAEPFTHTGALATYAASDDVTVYGGWVDGWDTGFEFTGGSQFIGGASVAVTDNTTVTYIFLAGDREAEAGFAQGYNHSVVVDVALTDKLNYVFHTDFVDYAGNSNQHQISVNQYLLYWYNDCLGFGARAEWYNVNEGFGPTGNAPNTGNSDLYQLTVGMNVRPHANLVVRPEVRWNWDDDGAVIPANANNTAAFGIDAILTF